MKLLLSINPLTWQVSTLLITCCILITLLMILSFTDVINAAKNGKTKIFKIRILLYLCFILIIGFIAAYLSSNYQIAKKHGLTTMQISYNKMMTGIENTPIEDKLPENLKGKIILYYKFGCKDCEAIYKDLHAATKDNKNIYWVSTQSKQGEKLRKDYPTDVVPSGVYIRQDDYDGSVAFTHKTLYTEDENGKTILDETSLNRLLYLQSEGR